MTYALVWLAVTTTAVFVAVAAVGSVRDQVTETPTAMVPTTTIDTSLADPALPVTEPGSEPPTLAPTITPTFTTTTVVGSSTTLPDVSTTTTPSPAPTTTTTTPPTTTPPTTTPPTTTTGPPATEIRSYELIGGSVTVEVGPNTVRLAGASPKAGFSMDVENSGPEKVEVEFKSESHESHFSGRFEDGAFVPKNEEEAHTEDS
jgi:hypothetical protein